MENFTTIQIKLHRVAQRNFGVTSSNARKAKNGLRNVEIKWKFG